MFQQIVIAGGVIQRQEIKHGEWSKGWKCSTMFPRAWDGDNFEYSKAMTLRTLQLNAVIKPISKAYFLDNWVNLCLHIKNIGDGVTMWPDLEHKEDERSAARRIGKYALNIRVMLWFRTTFRNELGVDGSNAYGPRITETATVARLQWVRKSLEAFALSYQKLPF